MRALQGHVHNQVADTYLLQFVLPLQDDRHAALRAPQARGSFPTLVSKEGFIGFGLPVLALGLGSRRPAWPPGLGPWSLVPGSASRSTVRRSPSPRQYDIRTQKHTRTYPYLRILKTFSGLPVTYVRTYQISSWGRAYNSGLVDSTHFCLADEAVKEKTITQRCSMYVRTYLFLFGLKNQLKEARGQEAPTPLDTDQLSSCSYYCLSPGGFPWHRVE